MFETEPILWLQAAGSPPLTSLLSLVSLLGYTPVYVALLLTLGFALRLRPSLAVIVVVLLTTGLTAALKAGLALPRPDQIDARVRSVASGSPVAVVERGGASGFWSLPRPDALAAARARSRRSYGFPSGHVSAATAFLLGVALFFRSRRVLLLAAVWVPAMALSRMYLGRHFLADVLGGFAVGVCCLALAAFLVRGLEHLAFGRRGRRAAAALALLALGLLGLAPFGALVSALHLGALAGVVLTYAFLALGGPPPEGGSGRQRLTRAASALALFALGATVFADLLDASPGFRPGALLAGLVVTTGTLVGTVALARGLERRS